MFAFHIVVSALALIAAFVAQWSLLPPQRTSIILWTAGVPSLLVVVGATLLALTSSELKGDLSGFQIASGLLFLFVTLMFAGIVAAIVGTEAASLTKRIVGRRSQ